MSATEVSRHYWYSDAFAAWLLAEPDKADGCRNVLEAAQEGELQLVTSTLTLAQLPPTPQAEGDDVVNRFFYNEFILLRPLDRRTAEHARQLRSELGLRADDAVHLATALGARIRIVETFDPDILNLAQRMASQLTIRKPHHSRQIALFDLD